MHDDRLPRADRTPLLATIGFSLLAAAALGLPGKAAAEKPRPVTVVVTIVKQLIPTEHQLKTNTLSFQFVCYTN